MFDPTNAINQVQRPGEGIAAASHVLRLIADDESERVDDEIENEEQALFASRQDSSESEETQVNDNETADCNEADSSISSLRDSDFDPKYGDAEDSDMEQPGRGDISSFGHDEKHDRSHQDQDDAILAMWDEEVDEDEDEDEDKDEEEKEDLFAAAFDLDAGVDEAAGYGCQGADEKRSVPPFYAFPNSETAKFAVLMSSNITSWKGWQLILNALHSAAFNISNLPRSVKVMKRYLKRMPITNSHTLTFHQTIHRKRKNPKKTTLSTFNRQVDPEPLPPIINTIRLQTVSILSIIRQYCARPDLNSLFCFSWTNRPTFQEFTDSPLHQEYFIFRRLLRVVHNQLQLSVGDFVQTSTDAHHVYRIDTISYQLEEKKGSTASCDHLLGPEHLQLCLKCTAFLIVKFWKNHYPCAVPADTESTDVIEIKDNLFHQFFPQLIQRTCIVLPKTDRPSNERRRPNWTSYCKYIYNTETKIFAEYVPLQIQLTPPEVRNGTYQSAWLRCLKLFACPYPTVDDAFGLC